MENRYQRERFHHHLHEWVFWVRLIYQYILLLHLISFTRIPLDLVTGRLSHLRTQSFP